MAANKSACHIRVSIVEKVERKSAFRLPKKDFNHALALYLNRALASTHHPSDRISNEEAEVRVPGTPKSPVNIAGKVGDARPALLRKDNRGLLGSGRARINHFRRKSRIGGDHTQFRPTGAEAADRHTILGAWQQRWPL